ncbi:MAG: DDE-type integrase/transposase/recombinase [Candidatus Thiodubiliella endoseptemdiera]|uniref:DDE-type integrase/transposase/recombinase n=1 Tax=Candidatus Thiodubiliella endoseptemdiera TaxID=2738886 RepID=A0A853F6K1_9GAMM|nr:DDE-type integrase/transposase/recombinase [Candidatus Thiodubiliella endoseptemdiera]
MYCNNTNSKWVSDTTFVWTQQGWLYLATVIDLYSRKSCWLVNGQEYDTALVIDALSMAIKNKPRQQQVLLHSDQRFYLQGL